LFRFLTELHLLNEVIEGVEVVEASLELELEQRRVGLVVVEASLELEFVTGLGIVMVEVESVELVVVALIEFSVYVFVVFF
jgi:hypothetical protein